VSYVTTSYTVEATSYKYVTFTDEPNEQYAIAPNRLDYGKFRISLRTSLCINVT